MEEILLSFDRLKTRLEEKQFQFKEYKTRSDSQQQEIAALDEAFIWSDFAGKPCSS